jgi:hypothetical protein
MKKVDIRENYEHEIIEEKDIYFGSRNAEQNTYNKWPTDLWMKVIQRAVDDLVFASVLRKLNITPWQEVIEMESSAMGFLFDEEYMIAFDDYQIKIKCPKCQNLYIKEMSEATSEFVVCECCNLKMNPKNISNHIIAKNMRKEISLEDLLGMIGIDNVDNFRTQTKKLIKKLTEKQRLMKTYINWKDKEGKRIRR